LLIFSYNGIEVIPLKKLLLFPILLLFLFGCQSQSISNEDNLNQDAKSVYLIIKDKKLNESSLSESERGQIDEFNDTYIKNYDKYKNKDLIMNMEKLINSYDFYYGSIGQKDLDSARMYKERLTKEISILDKEFNK
jgi:hypothetical protein